jgi:hypothetical protein
MKTLLWLDDMRDPLTNNWLQYSALSAPHNTIWVKSYNEFVAWITENGLPDGINFDHDLADVHYQPSKHYDESHPEYNKFDYNEWAKLQDFKEQTGFDCAKWLVDYCMDNSLPLPKWYTHSHNPVGKMNIDSYLNNYFKSINT